MIMSDKANRVITTRNGRTKQIVEFSVVYCSSTQKEFDDLPYAATFPVNQKYDEELQWNRAEDYANYLNKLDEAAKIAYDQIHLVDILKR